MCQASRSVPSLSNICEYSREKLSNYDEETFSILSFSDLSLPLTPCLNENSIEMLFKMPLETFPMDSQLKGEHLNSAEREEESFPISPSLAQLSPGLDYRDFEKDWLLDPPAQTSKNLDHLTEISDDFAAFLTSSGNFDSEDNFEIFLGLGDQSPIEVTATGNRGRFEQAVSWLTTTISSDHLALTGEASGDLGEIPSFKAEKQVLQELAIPSSVQESTLCDSEVTVSVTVSAPDTEKAAKSLSKSRKRSRQSVEPGSEEYKKKRELNNSSVRKSREKSRKKQQETEERVDILSTENDRLQSRVDSLEKELTILKGLFSNIGATLPVDVNNLFSAE